MKQLFRFVKAHKILVVLTLMFMAMVLFCYAQWLTVAGFLNVNRENHTATLVEGDKILVVGGSLDIGRNDLDTHTGNVELFDTKTGWSSLINQLPYNRGNHTAIKLHNGDVFIYGGWDDCGLPNKDCDHNVGYIYHAKMKTFEALQNEAGNFNGHTATLLSNGHVILFGGVSMQHLREPRTNCVAREFNPENKIITEIGSMPCRSDHSAVSLPSGDVILVGGTGFEKAPWPYPDKQVGIFNVSAQKYENIGFVNLVRQFPSLLVLPNNKVLIAGGESHGIPIPQLEVFDLSTRTSKIVGKVSNAGFGKHQLYWMPDKRILYVGIHNIDIIDSNSFKVLDTIPLKVGRRGLDTVMMPDSTLYIVGGGGFRSPIKRVIERFNYSKYKDSVLKTK